MKKILAGIAVLAVAAVAQADLLATWTIAKSTINPVQNEKTEITFGDMVANGLGNQTVETTAWRLTQWITDPGVVSGNSLDLPFTLQSGYQFALESVKGSMNPNGNPSPVNFKWQNENGVDVTGSVNVKTTSPATWTALESAPVWTSSGTLSLVAADGKNSAGNNASSGSRADIKSGLEVYGTVTQVPEPATMSLLGLGALAMVIRRKLSK
jgi:hypothetical protein